jgi:uncharacterized protein YxjI
MITTCPKCAKKVMVRDENVGKRVKCPGCSAIFVGAAPTREGAAGSAPVPKHDPAPVGAGSRTPAPKPRKPAKKPPEEEEFEEKNLQSELLESEVTEPEELEVGQEESAGSSVLDRNRFVMKQQAKLFSARKAYDIVDPESGETLATAKVKTSLMAQLLALLTGKEKMSLTLEVRDTENELLFAVRRSGLFFKKVRLLDGKGKVLGQYKAKIFSLAGGFHIYDKEGKHFAEIKGSWFKSEYTFLAPEGGKLMGTVSKKWGGMSRELLSGAGTFGVEVAPAYAENPTAKMFILGAAIAINAIFKMKGGKGGGEEDGEEADGGGDADE